jgi:hypothetical protein
VYACNNSKVDNTTEHFKISEDDGSWLMTLSAKSPLNTEELKRLFPVDLQGMTLIGVESAGVQTVVGTYSKNLDPDYTSTTISLTLVDGAGTKGFPHVNAIFKQLNSNINESFENGWAKTTMHNNVRILVREQTKAEKSGIPSTVTSSIDMIKNQRFHINLTGRHLPGNQLKRALDEVVKLSFPE